MQRPRSRHPARPMLGDPGTQRAGKTTAARWRDCAPAAGTIEPPWETAGNTRAATGACAGCCSRTTATRSATVLELCLSAAIRIFRAGNGKVRRTCGSRARRWRPPIWRAPKRDVRTLSSERRRVALAARPSNRACFCSTSLPAISICRTSSCRRAPRLRSLLRRQIVIMVADVNLAVRYCDHAPLLMDGLVAGPAQGSHRQRFPLSIASRSCSCRPARQPLRSD